MLKPARRLPKQLTVSWWRKSSVSHGNSVRWNRNLLGYNLEKI
ncbi:hypothetical protein AHF37_10479 [Paragonimus kellicotti]|nr:hypothetical protein AHF37_10479 [Paragonimus kellicotti]